MRHKDDFCAWIARSTLRKYRRKQELAARGRAIQLSRTADVARQDAECQTKTAGHSSWASPEPPQQARLVVRPGTLEALDLPFLKRCTWAGLTWVEFEHAPRRAYFC